MESIIREGSLRIQASEATCDVILSCQGHRLMAHKIILSIASPVLRDLLLQESGMNEPQILIFPDISSTTMSLILDFMYTGSVVVYSSLIDEFISIANFLKICVDDPFLEKYHRKIKTECKTDDDKDEKANESKEILKRVSQRKIPSLVPIASLTAKTDKRVQKLTTCVIPSPWCPRVKPVLSDPRNDYDLAEIQMLRKESKNENENDANNNLQCTPVFLPTKEMDLSPSKIEQRLHMNLDEVLTRNKQDVRRKECGSKKFSGQSCSENLESGAGQKVNKEKPFSCEDCGKSFSQLRNYKYHRSVHEGTKEFSAKCPECGKVFNDKGYLSSHMKIHRDRKEYACPHCPKRFNQRVAYNMHLRIHTGVKPHECPTCGKSFSRKMLLKQHQRVHTGERPYSCPECGKTFADRSNMSLHARLHTGVKPYACSLCSKSFTKKHHLKTHMNFHTGLKPYKCQLCGLAFSQSSNMRTHYKKCLLKGQNNGQNNVTTVNITDDCGVSMK